jgi:hypothetical protein
MEYCCKEKENHSKEKNEKKKRKQPTSKLGVG